MGMKTKPRDLGAMLLFCAALFWSLSGFLVKSVDWRGPSLSTLRGIIAFFVTLSMVRTLKIRLTPVKIINGICYFLQGLLLISANKFTTAGNATVLQNTSPIYIILLNAILLKKKPSRLEAWVSILLFAGIAMAFAGSFSAGGTLGNLLALVSGLFYAGVFFTNRLEGANPLESLLIGNGLYFLLIPILFFDPAVPQTSLKDLFYILTFSLLSGCIAWLCFSKGIQSTPALRANLITMAEPVLSPIWTFFLLDERMDPLSLLGCILVLVTLAVYNIVFEWICKKQQNPADTE